MPDWYYEHFLYWFDLDWERRALIRVFKRRSESISMLTGIDHKSLPVTSTQETVGVKSANSPKSESSG